MSRYLSICRLKKNQFIVLKKVYWISVFLLNFSILCNKECFNRTRVFLVLNSLSDCFPNTLSYKKNIKKKKQQKKIAKKNNKPHCLLYAIQPSLNQLYVFILLGCVFMFIEAELQVFFFCFIYNEDN